MRPAFTLTGREIEEIFKAETIHIDPSDIEAAFKMQVKPNQKQPQKSKEFKSGNIVMCLNDVEFIDGSYHYRFKKYIVTDETEAYFNVNKRNYELVSNAKQFKQFNESLFKAYINKFSEEDKIQMLATLACETSTTNINLNDLLNRISCYKKNK